METCCCHLADAATQRSAHPTPGEGKSAGMLLAQHMHAWLAAIYLAGRAVSELKSWCLTFGR